MLAIAVSADLISALPFHADGSAQWLSLPVFMGGSWRLVLGTDELGRDCAVAPDHFHSHTPVIAFGASIIGAVIGRRRSVSSPRISGGGSSKQAVLALVDFSRRHSLPGAGARSARLFSAIRWFCSSACSASMPGNAMPALPAALPSAARRMVMRRGVHQLGARPGACTAGISSEYRL